MQNTSLIVPLVFCIVAVFAVAVRIRAMIDQRVAILYRIDAKLDLLLRQANIAYDPLEGMPSTIIDALQAGQKIKAIKLYRETSGTGLKEAKDFIEAAQRKLGL